MMSTNFNHSNLNLGEATIITSMSFPTGVICFVLDLRRVDGLVTVTLKGTTTESLRELLLDLDAGV